MRRQRTSRNHRESLGTIEALAPAQVEKDGAARDIDLSGFPIGDASPMPSRVLIVEDSPSDWVLLRELLRDVGVLDVDRASTLNEALLRIAGTVYDLVLLDLSLPDARELEAVVALAGAISTTPIVVTSARVGDSLAYAAMANGADEYLNKGDLSAEGLEVALRRATSRRVGNDRRDRVVRLTSQAFKTLEAPAVALDSTGRIVAVNESWSEVGRQRGAAMEQIGIGVNYLTVCDNAFDEADCGSKVSRGIRSVLKGTSPRFDLDYPFVAEDVEEWFSVRVTPASFLGGGALVIHLNITELKKVERQVQALQNRLSDAIDFAKLYEGDEVSPIFALVDAEGAFLHRSTRTNRILKISGSEESLASSIAMVVPEDAALARAVFDEVLKSPSESRHLVVRVLDGSGRRRTLDLTLTNRLNDPAVAAITVEGTDVTLSRYTKITKSLESRVLKKLPAAVVVTESDGTVIYWNDRATALYGYEEKDVVGRSMENLRVNPATEAEIAAALKASGVWEGDSTVTNASGTPIAVHLTLEEIDAPDVGFHGIVTASVDISERRALEESLEFQARHDVLTGLPNRRFLLDHLETALLRSHARSGCVAVLYVDFDDFKLVNERFGHAYGDEFLCRWTEIVKAGLQSGEFLARVSGDKFVICCERVADADSAVIIADRIIETTALPLVIGSQNIVLTTCVGVALSGANSTPEGLLRNADVAMYAAKQSGRSKVELFDDSHHESVKYRNGLRLELARAIRDGEISAYFQPEVDLATGQIIGFEALARWYHPERGFIAPDEFIPLAEESGLIGPLGELMLESSCSALKEWKTLRPDRDFTVAVNVSALQLFDLKLASTLADICEAHDVAMDSICLEVTESALIDESEVFETLTGLKARGFRIALDDFGTGYSSLKRLTAFPMDFLKIDRSFIAGMSWRHEDGVIVSAVIGLARSLNLQTIAEGIENNHQWTVLRNLGCQLGQGFLWAEAIDVRRATELISHNLSFSVV